VGAFNGAGINKADTNDHKDLSARLLIRPFEGLSVGGSYYDGLTSTAAAAPRTTRRRFGGEAAWVTGPFRSRRNTSGPRTRRRKRDGGYVQAAVFVLPKRCQVLFKYDAYDKDRAAAGRPASGATTAGLNWFLADRSKLQVNYLVFRSRSGSDLEPRVRSQFQLAF